jgi:hypothetical protein
MEKCAEISKNGKPCERLSGHAGLHGNSWCSKHPEELRPWYGGRYQDCKLCVRHQNVKHREIRLKRAAEKRRSDPHSKMFSAAKTRAKQLEVPFDLTIADLPIIPEYCPILGIKIEMPAYTEGIGRASHGSPSLDRIRPEKGYVKGNIRIISNRANTLKRDASAEELRLIAEDAQKLLLLR